MQVKFKEFKAPSEKFIKVYSDDFFHSAIVEDTWTLVREELWKAAYSAGCISKDMMVKGMDKDETLAAIKHEEVVYEQQVIEAMKAIVDLGDPELVDSSGRPKVSVIGERVGKQPTMTMRNALYKKAFGT